MSKTRRSTVTMSRTETKKHRHLVIMLRDKETKQEVKESVKCSAC
jgi:hypothetical protein